MPVASDTARAIGILGSLRWATGIARARQCRLELSLDHRLDELAHPIAQADFDRIKPIVEKMDRRLGLRLQGCRVRAIAGHGVVSTGAQTPGLLGFQHPETTPPSIPTTPRTAPFKWSKSTGLAMNSQAQRLARLVAAVVIPIGLLLRRIRIDWHDASSVETGDRTRLRLFLRLRDAYISRTSGCPRGCKSRSRGELTI